MIKLNLISPTYKKALETRNFLTNIRNIFLYLTIFVATSGIVLLIVRNDLEKNFVDTVESSNLITSQPDKKNRETKEANTKINLAKEVQANYIPWSRLIISISNIVPENIYFKSLNVKKANNNLWSVSIDGFAANRDDFLALKDKLEQSTDLFTSVKTPIGNMFKKDNIDFTIDLEIKNETLTKLSLE